MPRAERPLRFVLAGAANTAFGLAIYPLLLWGVPAFHTHYLIALGVAQAISLCFAFATYKIGVFRTRGNVEELGLGDDELAIRVGGSASRALFEHHAQQAEASGSASSQDLLDEDSHVIYEGRIDQHPLLRRAVADPQVRSLLLAPLLVCTIDHLTPATESQRGGRQIAPMLRLLSGDLVLDEPDDFGLGDLPALTRLVQTVPARALDYPDTPTALALVERLWNAA